MSNYFAILIEPALLIPREDAAGHDDPPYWEIWEHETYDTLHAFAPGEVSSADEAIAAYESREGANEVRTH
jgi:hypothetical protein